MYIEGQHDSPEAIKYHFLLALPNVVMHVVRMFYIVEPSLFPNLAANKRKFKGFPR